MEKWIAVYTKSRHEKVVIQELEKKNIEAYCPILKERRQWSDRKRWVEFPLFRSYVFVKIELKNSLYILQTWVYIILSSFRVLFLPYPTE